MGMNKEQEDRVVDIFTRATVQTEGRFYFKTETKEGEKYLESMYTDVYNKKLNKSCGACLVSMLNFLRIKVGLPSLVDDSGKTLYQNRIEACKGCIHLSKSGLNCKKCLCFVNIKARFKIFSCPIGNW